jgi:hypothetical protein
MEGLLGVQSGFPQEIQDRDPTLYTLTVSGTCTDDDKEQPRSDTTDLDYFRNYMKA